MHLTHVAAPNRLLAALPADEYERLSADATAVPLPVGKILHRPGEPPDLVYFPSSGVCSFTTRMRDGRIVEVGTIGREGFVGLSAHLGEPLQNVETIVQVPGEDALAVRLDMFRAELERGGTLRTLVARYAQAFLALMMQSVACNALHDVPQRAARWLLMTADRTGDRFQLTHEYLAAMLGVRRPTVTLIARDLQAAGLIAYRRREIVITDRAGLEKAACECYGVVKAQFDRLLP